jgi:hypothetical protein
MKGKTILEFISLFFFINLFVFISCKNDSRTRRNNDPGYIYLRHLPPSGQYYLTIKTQTTSTIDQENKEIENDNSIEIGLLYELLKDSSGQTQLKLTYDKIKLTLESTNAGKQVYDADNISSPAQIEQLLSQLKGNSLTVHFDSTGQAKSVNGIEEIYTKVLSNLPVTDPAIHKALQEQLAGFVGAGFIKNSLEPAGRLFPDTMVRVGDNWNRQLDQEGGVNFTALGKFTLVSLENKTAEVEVKSTITNSKYAPINISGYRVNTNITGNQTGQFKIDILTGMLQEAKTRTNLKGEIQVLNKTIPITITIKKDIVLRKK